MEIGGDLNKIFYQQLVENFENAPYICVLVSFMELFWLQIIDNHFAYFVSVKCFQNEQGK